MATPPHSRRTLQASLLAGLAMGAPLSAGPLPQVPGVRIARRMLREVHQRHAERRYGTSSSALAVSEDMAVRYRGLMPVKTLAITEEPCLLDPPGIACFELRSDTGPLIAPGILSLDLSRFDFPRGPVRNPMETVEVYQELRHGRGWVQLLPTRRDLDRRKLVVHRDDLGTGRFALAWRLHQPTNLVEIFRDDSRDAPQFVYVHGTDGARSDYWGVRDVLASASCWASSVYYFQYPSGLSIPTNAAALRNALIQLPPLPPGRRRVLMGFSMGGLVARYALERLHKKPQVDELVLLATPNSGDRLLATVGHLPGLARTQHRGLEAWPGLRDMIPGSNFLKILNHAHGATSPRTLVLVGQVDFSGDLVVGVNSAHLPRDREPAQYHVSHRKDFMNLNRLSHWGSHQEFRVNGFERDLLDWLGLPEPEDCALDRQRLRTNPVIRPLRGRAAARRAPSG